MTNTENLMQELQEDIDQRMQVIQEREQEKAVRAQAVADAEANMAAAIAANDEKAHHEAEGALTFAKARLAALEEEAPWWTPEEAAALVEKMYEACTYERKEQITEAHSLLCAAEERLREACRLAGIGEQYQIRVRKRVPLSHSWGFGAENALLQDLQGVVRRLQNRYCLPAHQADAQTAEVDICGTV